MAENPKELAAAQKLANEAMKESNDLTRTLGDLLSRNIDKAGKMNKLIENRAKTLGTMLGNTEEDLSTFEKIKNVQKNISSTESKLAQSRQKSGGFAKGFNQHIERGLKLDLEGLSAERSRLVLDELREKVYNRLLDVAKKLRNALTIGGILAAGFKILQSFSGTLDTVGKTFGSLNVLGEDLTGSLVNASTEASKLGFGIDEVSAVTADLASNFGISLDQASQLSTQILDTAKATGLSVDETTNLVGQLKVVAGLSADQSESLIEGTAQLARQAGVAPQQVLKDIAASSETIAIFTKDSGENLFEAAVAARQFGLNIDSVAKAARSTLDFESSIAAEVEASVMLGKQLNLQKAREAALNKDLVGFQEEIKNQLGDIGDFTELGVFEQESLAKALGYSVTEVAKLASGTEKLSVAGALSAGTFEDISGQTALSNLSQLTGKFNQLSKTFLNSLGPVLNDVVGSVNTFLANEENVEKLRGTFRGLANTIGAIVTNIPLIIAGFTAMGAFKFVGALSGLKAITSAMKGQSIIAGLSAIMKGGAMGGPLGIAATVAAAIAGFATFKSLSNSVKVDDVAIPSGGANVITGPAGSFQLNPNDQVVAGTNLGSGGSKMDMNPLVEAVNKTTDAITNLQLTAGRGEIRVAMEAPLG